VRVEAQVLRDSGVNEKFRRKAVNHLRAMLNKGMLRKQAFLIVRSELKEMGYAHSRATIYLWANKFKVSLK
jgi:hypothetical protein